MQVGVPFKHFSGDKPPPPGSSSVVQPQAFLVSNMAGLSGWLMWKSNSGPSGRVSGSLPFSMTSKVDVNRGFNEIFRNAGPFL